MAAQSGLGFSGIVAINIPDDGAPGTVLTKITADNYDYDWLPGGGGGGSTVIVEDEGIVLGVPADTLNFVGAGVTAAGAGTTKTITIPGGGGPASTDWLEFVSQAVNPGVVAANTLYQDDGSNFDVDTVAMGDLTIPMLLTGNVGLGDPGTEQGGILVNGVNFDATAKINDFGGTVDAMLVMHRHSTAFGSNLVFARSNSDTSAHAALTAGQTISQQVHVGWSGTHYDIAAFINVDVPLGTTVSPTSLAGEFSFYTTPDLSNISLLSLIIGSDQIIYGDITPGGTLDLQGSKDADRGRIIAHGGITIDWDWTSDAITTGGLTFAATIPASGGIINANITIANNITVNAALFIQSALDDLSTLNWTVAPGFAVTTLFFARQTYRGLNAGIPPAQTFVYAAQCAYDIQGAGSITVGNYRALSFAPIIRVRNAGDNLTITNVNGLTVAPLWNTNNAAAVADFGTIRGVHMINPAQALFGQSVGTERCANIIGLDYNNMTLTTSGVRAVVRSALTASTQNFFLQNNSTAESDFGAGDIHLDDNTYIKHGGSIAVADIWHGWFTSQAAMIWSTIGNIGSNPLFLRPAATDTWTFQQSNLGTQDIGLGFNVNAVSFGVIDPVPNSNNWFVMFAGPNLRQVQIGGEYSDVLWTASGSIDVNGQAVSNLQAFKINSPAVLLNGGTISDLSNLFVEAMPSFGATRVQALRVLGRARIDGAMNNGSQTEAIFGANQNDLQLGPNNAGRTMNLLSASLAVNLTGIDASFGFAQTGDRICLYNTGAFNITITNQDVLSLAANRIITSTGVGYVIGPNECVWLWYDDTGTARWRMLEGTGA